jgi:Na+/proline symporter
VLFVQVQAGRLSEPRFWPYMLIVAFIPLIAWRFLRTTSEFIVGVFLLAASAVTSVGGAYTLGGAALRPDNGLLFGFVPIAAVALIGLGIYEHRRFRTLRDQLHAHQEEQDHGDDA